jgi:hypothetical protein
MRGYPYTSLPNRHLSNRHLPNRHRPYKHPPNRHRPYKHPPNRRQPNTLRPKNHLPNRHRPSTTPTKAKQNPNKHKKLLHHTKNGEFSHKTHHFHAQKSKISEFSRCQPPQLPFWHPPTQFLRANAVAAPYVTPQLLCVKQLQHTTRCNTPHYHLKIVRFVRRVAVDRLQQQHTIRCVNERRPPHTHFVLFVRRMGA